MKFAAEGLVGDLEPDLAGAERARIVAENLALPFRLGEIAPAFRRLRRGDVLGVDQHREIAGAHRQEGAVGLERGCDLAGVGEFAVRRERAFGGLQRDRGRARVDQVADGAAGGLLGADALADFAGAAIEHVDRDAVVALELIGEEPHDAKAGAVVDREPAFALGRGGDGGPGLGLGEGVAWHQGDDERKRQRGQRLNSCTRDGGAELKKCAVNGISSGGRD